MNNKVLIIYPFINQEPLMFHLVENLRNNGISVDAINSFNFKFSSAPLHGSFLQAKVISFLFNLPIPRIKGFLSKLINKDKILFKIASKYDLIDFHYSAKAYDNLIKELSKDKVIKITYWGSDFYRANSERKEEQRDLLKLAKRIEITTETMKNDFLGYFKDFKEKIRVANFGLHQFDVISKVENSSYPLRFKTGKHKNKLMVVCGYNGSEVQQHTVIIEAIDRLDKSIKDKIFLVFPMTYGGGNSYIELIQDKLKGLKLPFLILKNHLSDIDIAKLRLETDIAINVQISDAFSGSLQEHLFAENLLLVGDWLPYHILDENQVYLKRTQIENLDIDISDCIINFESYNRLTSGNKEKMEKISSWQSAGKRISHIYKEIQL